MEFACATFDKINIITFWTKSKWLFNFKFRIQEVWLCSLQVRKLTGGQIGNSIHMVGKTLCILESSTTMVLRRQKAWPSGLVEKPRGTTTDPCVHQGRSDLGPGKGGQNQNEPSRYETFNPLTAKLFILNFQPRKVVELQVGENYWYLTKWRSTISKSCWFMSRFITNMFKIFNVQYKFKDQI